MPLVLQREHVLDLYAEAARRMWVLPTFNTENLTTTEAILDATLDYSNKSGIVDLPIIVGITNNYKPRSQSVYYSHTRKWDIGMRLFLKDLEVLTSPGSPFSKLKVMIHLDHIQWDDDLELLDWDMGLFSSIMYDASTLPFDKNIQKTAEFRIKNSDRILIEGACDEIGHSKQNDDNGLTTPENARRYFDETGVDIIVANLGTEHRASSSELKYRGELAKKISSKSGAKLCLHGTSSVAPDDLSNLFEDGIRKVNIWTALERKSSLPLFSEMVKNASKIIGLKKAKELASQGLLGLECDLMSRTSVGFCTTTYRQDIVFKSMKELVLNYLNIFYKI